MKVNTITEFHSFINELDLKNRDARKFLYTIFADKERAYCILDLEKRKVIQTSQTFSLDSDWFSHVEETTIYELYIETRYSIKNRAFNVDTMVLTFRTLKDLRIVERFIKDNVIVLKPKKF